MVREVGREQKRHTTWKLDRGKRNWTNKGEPRESAEWCCGILFYWQNKKPLQWCESRMNKKKISWYACHKETHCFFAQNKKIKELFVQENK